VNKDFPWVEFDMQRILFDEEARKTVDRFVEEVTEFLLTKTKQELFEECIEKSIILVPVNDARDVVHSPQLAAREFWAKVEHPELGEDRWVAIAVSSEEEWEDFCCVIGNPEWTKDTKFSTFLGRKQNEDELDRLVAEWTKDYTPEQIMTMMQDAGVPAGMVEAAEDLFNDPQLKHREHFRFLEHKVIGRHAYNAPAYQLSKTPNHIWKSGPCLSEDNEYVYKEILGYTDDDIADMLIEGVITTDTDVPSGL